MNELLADMRARQSAERDRGLIQVCCSALQCVVVCCSVLQCVAVCCSVLQCVAVCCSVQHIHCAYKSLMVYMSYELFI